MSHFSVCAELYYPRPHPILFSGDTSAGLTAASARRERTRNKTRETRLLLICVAEP